MVAAVKFYKSALEPPGMEPVTFHRLSRGSVGRVVGHLKSNPKYFHHILAGDFLFIFPASHPFAQLLGVANNLPRGDPHAFATHRRLSGPAQSVKGN
jgi:hypothetical protein